MTLLDRLSTWSRSSSYTEVSSRSEILFAPRPTSLVAVRPATSYLWHKPCTTDSFSASPVTLPLTLPLLLLRLFICISFCIWFECYAFNVFHDPIFFSEILCNVVIWEVSAYPWDPGCTIASQDQYIFDMRIILAHTGDPWSPCIHFRFFGGGVSWYKNLQHS